MIKFNKLNKTFSFEGEYRNRLIDEKYKDKIARLENRREDKRALGEYREASNKKLAAKIAYRNADKNQRRLDALNRAIERKKSLNLKDKHSDDD